MRSKPPLPQTLIFFCASMVEERTLLKQVWMLMSGGRTTGDAFTLSSPVEAQWQLMKEYLDSMLRQTLLLTQELIPLRCDIISVSRNCQTDSRNISSTVLVTIAKYSSGPQEKCKLTISDSMSCPTKRPSMLTMDLSLVRISTLNLCERSPLGQVMKPQSMPTRQLPLERTVCDLSTDRKKLYSRSPYSLRVTILKEKPRKRKRRARVEEMTVAAMHILQRSFI